MSESAITPVTEWPEWKANPNGGDPLTQDLNAMYNKGDLCWMLVSTVLCWQITPVSPRRTPSPFQGLSPL
jgi:ammonium transporter, Amt family